MYNKKEIAHLRSIAKKIKLDIIQMSYLANSAHTGGSLSCVEIMTALYFNCMVVNPKKPYDPKRDRLIFSKGHDSKVLYAVLAEKGFFSKSILKTYEQNNGKLPTHPTRHCVPGVEVSAGSLGHGLSMAAGMSYALKLDKKRQRVFAILSDGECDEGSTWEAILFAGHHKLHNLVVIVDYNKLQGFGYTKDILNLEPFAKKWESFGWQTKEINGHNFKEIIQAVRSTSLSKPTVIIAHTIKGFEGPKQHVGQVSSQYKPPTAEELKEMMGRLS